MPHFARDAAPVVILALLFAGSAGAIGAFDRDTAFQTSQNAIGRTLDDYQFTAADGSAFSLGEVSGAPVVISLIFTSCMHTCPLITRQLELAVRAARETFGADAFSVLTIGFDTANDSPERMRAYAHERGITDPNWYFLSADSATINRLAEATGFLFFPSSMGYDHLAQVTVVDGARRVYHQIYGDSFTPPALVEPLKRIALGGAARKTGVGALLEKVRLLCTFYDPASGKYQIDYSLIVTIAAGLSCLLGIAIFAVRAWREATRRDFPA